MHCKSFLNCLDVTWRAGLALKVIRVQWRYPMGLEEMNWSGVNFEHLFLEIQSFVFKCNRGKSQTMYLAPRMQSESSRLWICAAICSSTSRKLHVRFFVKMSILVKWSEVDVSCTPGGKIELGVHSEWFQSCLDRLDVYLSKLNLLFKSPARLPGWRFTGRHKY